MSLLLDALNRASKDKATAAAVAEAAVSKSGDPVVALPGIPPDADWPTLGLALTPTDSDVAIQPPKPRSAGASRPVGGDMKLVVDPAAFSTPPAALRPVLPVAGPESAPISGPAPATVGAPGPGVPSTSNPSPTPAAPAVTKPAPDNASRVAQSIVRAKAPASPGTHRTRLIVLIGIAILLAGGLGTVMLDLWSDPMALFQPQTLQKPSTQPVPAATALAVEPPAPLAAAAPIAVVQELTVPTRSPAVAPRPIQIERRTPQTLTPVTKPRTKQNVAAPASNVETAPNICAPGLTLKECTAAASRTKPVAPTSKPAQATLQSRSTGPSALEQGYAALTQGRLADATQAYTQALLGNPEERDALLGLAYIAHRQGRADNARAYYQRVLRQEPGNAVAKAGLLTLSPANDAQELGSRSREVAEQNPDSAAAQSLLGHTLVRQGRLADARLAFERAHMLEPDVALHAFNLAVALDRLHNYSSARLYYEQALTLSTRSGGERASGVTDEVIRARLEQLRAANL